MRSLIKKVLSETGVPHTEKPNYLISKLKNKIKGDPSRLRQILINLVGNAIKFTEKGIINLEVEKKSLSEDDIIIQFTVSDTGVGIADEHLGKIFNSFEQEYSDTSRKFGGTGLGLSISKKLVELQKGKIWAESDKGKGSRFHFTLPFEISKDLNEASKKSENNIDLKSTLEGIKSYFVRLAH